MLLFPSWTRDIDSTTLRRRNQHAEWLSPSQQPLPSLLLHPPVRVSLELFKGATWLADKSSILQFASIIYQSYAVLCVLYAAFRINRIVYSGEQRPTLFGCEREPSPRIRYREKKRRSEETEEEPTGKIAKGPIRARFARIDSKFGWTSRIYDEATKKSNIPHPP